MTLTPCEEEPAWNEYDNLLADGIWYLVAFTVNGEECETVSVTYYGKEMKASLFRWRGNPLDLCGELRRVRKEYVFEGRLRLHDEDSEYLHFLASSEVQLFPQG